MFLMFGVLALVLLQCCGHGSLASTTADQIDSNTGIPRKPQGAVLIDGLWNSMMVRGPATPATPSAPSKCINSTGDSRCPSGREKIHDLDSSNLP